MKSWIISLIFTSLIGDYALADPAMNPDFYAAFLHTPPSINIYHYEVPTKILKAQFDAATQKAKQSAAHDNGSASATLVVLPKFYVFDQNGLEIYSGSGNDKELTGVLNHLFSTDIPIHDGTNLAAWLSTLDPVDKQLIFSPKIAGDYTVLEYWAPWCTYCFSERDQLLSYFSKHQDLHVNWITVNDDIAKAAGFNPTAASSNSQNNQ